MRQVNLPVMKKGGFFSNVGNAGLNLGKAYLDYNASALGLTELVPDSAYKGNTGKFFGKATNVIGNITKSAAPAVVNAIVPGAGTALGAAQAGLGDYNKPLKRFSDKTIEPPAQQTPENQVIEQPQYMGDASLGTTYRAYKKGGEVEDVEYEDMVLINVEGGELEVTPDTFEVVQDFKDLPKHPKGKDIVNQKGNVHCNSKNIIIPANKREAFLKAKGKEKSDIVNEIVVNAKKTAKKEDGGLAQMPEEETSLVLSPERQKKVNDAYYKQGADAQKSLGQQPDYATEGAVGAAASIPGLVFGMQQTKRSKEALDALNKTPLPKYGITPEQLAAQKRAGQSYSRAQGLAKQGYTEAEKAAFAQNLAKSNATSLYNARNQAGGQLSGAINASLGSQSLNALLNFASNDAALNRQNIRYADQAGQYLDQTGQEITGQKNLQTNVDIQRRLMQEQALGKALSEGRVNTTNSASQLAGSAAMLGAQFL